MLLLLIVVVEVEMSWINRARQLKNHGRDEEKSTGKEDRRSNSQG